MNEWDGEKEITGGDAAGEGVVPDVERDELGGQLCEPDGNGAEQVVEAAMVSDWMSSPASRTTWRGATWSGSIAEEGERNINRLKDQNGKRIKITMFHMAN